MRMDSMEGKCMNLLEDIGQVFAAFPAKFSDAKGVFTVEYVVAERKAFLSKKKLTYIAKYRLADDTREIHFTEMLKESGSGLSSGGNFDDSPGFGFKKETYKIGGGLNERSIEEQSVLFGKQYSYSFDFKTIRAAIEKKAQDAGYAFKYHITSIGL